MSADMAVQARAAMKAKAQSMAGGDPRQKVDASSWTPPELMNGWAKTGERPISRRQFADGGSVQGAAPTANAGRAPRAGGGKAMTPNNYINRDVREANEEREGVTHIGGFAYGGSVGARMGNLRGSEAAGKYGLSGEIQGTRPMGGRLARKAGGKTNPKTNINIVINAKPDKPDDMAAAPPPMPPPPIAAPPPMAMKPPMPPPGAPPMPPPGAKPMGFKMGGSVSTNDKPDGGSGGGLGRLEKVKLQRKAARA